MSEHRVRPRPVAGTVLLVALAVTLVPLAYLFSVSLMGRDETVAGVLWSADPHWSNWADVLATDIPRAILNSVAAAIGGSVLSLALAVPGAWAIVRHHAGGRTLAATLMSPWLLPPIVAVVPLLILLRVLGLNNTLLGLTLVYALVNVPVAVWLLEGFVRRLPVEIEEAARLDGAGSVRMLWSVVVPLLLPSLVAIGIIVAILNYNEFLLATFLTQSVDSQTFPVALSLFYGDRTPHFGKIAAASFLGVVPVFAAAVFFQRWLVGGLTAGAVR
ncbi:MULTISPECIES: carbohydrate ABC transporter permease [unclassified Microbacterium]|uniref:carbohydrate ABC transporter permease n=1 Tax=unclassified Microbacterium TaxID=2609290 RepID=UPI00341463B4